MAIDPKSFVWASTGIEPINEEDAVYVAGDQPVAGFDNFINWAITSDLHDLIDWSGAHAHVHEAGGSQQIDLDGLDVDGLVTLDRDGDEFHLTNIEDEFPHIRLDASDDAIRAFPEFRTPSEHREGIEVDDDIERYDGETIYDHSSNWFHRAEEAIEAEWADLAGDSELLEGYPASAFIQPDDPAVNPTGVWEYDQPIHGDLIGHATTAGYANEAGWAEEAELAFDSERLEGYTLAEILAMIDDDLEGIQPRVQDDGQTIIDDVDTLNFGESIEVTDTGADTARMDVWSVPHSDESDQAEDSYHLEGYTLEEILEMFEEVADFKPFWTKLADWEGYSGSGISWEHTVDDVYDRYKLVVYHEHQAGSAQFLKLNLNDDYRARYTRLEIGRAPSAWEFDYTADARHWPIAPVSSGKSITTEYEIAYPDAMGSVSNHYPRIKLTGGALSPWARWPLERGSLGSVYPDGVETFSLKSANSVETGVKVELYGTNIQT